MALATVMVWRGEPQANQELSEIQRKEEAREAAISALNLSLSKMDEDKGPWTDASLYEVTLTTYQQGSYSTAVSIPSPGDTAEVRAVGQYADTTHTIEVKIVRNRPSGDTGTANTGTGNTPDEGPVIAVWKEW